MLLGLAVLASGTWVALALLFHPDIAAPALRALLALVFAAVALATLATQLLPRLHAWRRRVGGAWLAALASFAVVWSQVEPSNTRDWLPEVSRPPRVELDGDVVRFVDVRDFDYRSETDYTPRWHDREFHLSQLQGVDLWAVHWMGPAIAHTMVSFDFGAEGRIAISVEGRKERGEGYSTLLGFFRHYELIFIVGEERDLIGVRAIHRLDPPEQVYRYKLMGTTDDGRAFLRSYAARINAVAERPRFYNTLTTNCTTVIWQLAEANPKRVPFSWKVLASGYGAEYLYEQGRLDTRASFAELTRLGHVNARAQAAAAESAAAFSDRIRDPALAPASAPATPR